MENRMTNYADIPFKRNAVEPIKCLKDGFNLIKGQYWLFVGICLVAILVGSVVPLGILMGPMMCGIYLTFFSKRRGLPIEFATVFKGFDYFGPSVIATLIHVVPIITIMVPSYILFYVGLFLVMPRPGDEPDASGLFIFIGVMVIFWLVIVCIMIVISVAFTFSYPLIVEYRLQGLDAVKLSARAAFANFWRLLGLSLLSGLLGFAGILLCYVGVFFVFPISFSALAIAYEQVFGLDHPQTGPDLPPPPPVFT
jgi:hypothetical protein